MQKQSKLYLLCGAAILAIVLVFFLVRPSHPAARTTRIPAASITLPFIDGFKTDGALEETGSAAETLSPYWWLNSGARISFQDGIARTVQGRLPEGSDWQKLYAKSDSDETDGGYRPQNIFRLLTRNTWQDVISESYFKVNFYDPSESQHRFESNGLLLFQRYQDSDNLYYAGLRVDGHAVIKKKIGGTYYTLADEPVVSGDYNREDVPNLIPLGTWIGLKVETRTIDSTKVLIKLYADIGKTGTWTQVAEATDDGEAYGGRAWAQAGRAGIRTDFMDVEFRDFALREFSAR